MALRAAISSCLRRLALRDYGLRPSNGFDRLLSHGGFHHDLCGCDGVPAHSHLLLCSKIRPSHRYWLGQKAPSGGGFLIAAHCANQRFRLGASRAVEKSNCCS